MTVIDMPRETTLRRAPLDGPVARDPNEGVSGTTGLPLAGRRFLIVTAPFGPFSRQMAKTLRRRGAEVTRMIFNAGDAFDWKDPSAIRFTQSVREWSRRVQRLGDNFTDLIVFGEAGPYNQAVLNQAEQMPARVWVLENGYFRPDWITVERNGVNARSQLPRHARGYGAPIDPPAPHRPAGRVLPHHVVNISLYHTVQILGRLLYPRYSRPYAQSALAQCFGHIRRFIALALTGGDVDVEALADRGPFFIVCLQREGDVQLLRYSSYPDNTAFLAAVMESFSRHAPEEARLVVKNHPLDPGLLDQSEITRCLAAEYGIQERVDYIDGGNLARLCRASSGMVVNNSSAALSALGFATPVKVMGQAFFDFEGLTDQQPLERFWFTPKAPDPELFTRFRSHVLERSQVNGSFHDPRLRRMTAEGLADVFASAEAVRAQPNLKLVAAE